MEKSTAAALAALDEAGKLTASDAAMCQSAMELARAIGTSQGRASGIALAVRELREVMAALADTGAPEGQGEAFERVAAKLAGASS